VLLNLRLGREVAAARELEALNTMSAFFVHDLKNAAASLNLMLRNLPVHFDDPAFRADAIRAIGNTTGRIEDMIVRLSSFRQGPALSQVPTDLNALVCEALEAVGPSADVELTRDLGSLPKIAADRDQLRSVVTNLVLNARDALEMGGAICVRTAQQNGRVVLSVSDNGTGMSAAFVKEQLFRPFQSTKKKGLGIGLFQCRAIVQAHGGGIHAESEPGRGTTFVVTLPVAPEQ
jgi:putative PEP-CTERM system histidine kinase